MRTTIDISDPILKEIKAIHEREGRSMGSVVSELLAEALAYCASFPVALPEAVRGDPLATLQSSKVTS